MTFSALLAPLTTDDFFARHWGRAPLFLTGRRDRFAGVPFDLDELRRELVHRPPTVGIKAQFFDASRRHREMAITDKQLRSCFDAGMTVGVGPVEQIVPRMQEWVRALRQGAGFAGAFPVMCYWSPTGSGFGWHYDEVGVFILQMRGQKRWWFSPSPSVECPPRPFVYSAAGLEKLRAEGMEVAPPREDEAQTVLLEPGDLLYLPAGTWHRTAAEGLESVALTVGAVSGGAEQLVQRCLSRWMGGDRTWSRALPFVAPAELADGRLPGVVEHELGERLQRLKTFVQQLSVDDLVRMWSPEQA